MVNKGAYPNVSFNLYSNLAPFAATLGNTRIFLCFLIWNDVSCFIFQDPDQTLYTYEPDLSRCFQFTILSWIPPAVLWFSSGFYIPYLLSLPSLFGWRDKSKLNILKMVRTFL